jgi:hypothetical protein
MEQTITVNKAEYTYQHVSGEVVTVGSFEEALGRCAVLGSEDTTPEEARLLFELYSQGVEVLNDDAKEDTENEKTEKIEDEENDAAVVNQEQPREKMKQPTENPKNLDIKSAESYDIKTEKPTAQSIAKLEPIKPTNPVPKRETSGRQSAEAAGNQLAVGPSDVMISQQSEAKMSQNVKAPGQSPDLFKSEIPAEAAETRSGPTAQTEAGGFAGAETLQPRPLNIEFDKPAFRRQETTADSFSAEIKSHEELFLINENVEPLFKNKPESDQSEAIYYETDVFDFNENEILDLAIKQQDQAVLDIQFEASVGQGADAPVLEAELVSELTLPIETVGDAVSVLAEKIEALAADEFEAVQEILDDISYKAAEVHQATAPDTALAETVLDPLAAEAEVIDPAEIKQELQELFVELFEAAGLDYTPELIEALAELSISGTLAEIINPEIESESKPEDDTNLDRGTHEIIKQIQATISNLKRKMANAYRVGSSILALYKLEFLSDMGH